MKTFIIALTIAIAMFTAVAEAKTTKYGNWRFVEETDKLTGQREAYIWADATVKDSRYSYKEPSMGIKCDALYFLDLDVLNDGNLNFRVDTMAKPKRQPGYRYEGHQGIEVSISNTKRFWSKYSKHFKRMIAGNKIIVRFNSWGRDGQTIEVPLNGFTQAITSLASACSI